MALIAMFVLLLVAAGCGLIGLFFLSEATAGVGLIAFACLLAILARIAQASAHRHPPAS